MTAVRAQSSLNPRSDPASPWWHIDLSPVLAVIGLAIIGLFAVFSATRGRDPENYITSDLERQGLFIAVGLVLVIVTLFFDYRLLLRLAPMGYVGAIGLLTLVLLIGVEVNGATSWFEFAGFRAQPSEFAKIAVIVTVAAIASQTDEGPLSGRALIAIMAAVSLPIALVVMQPDVGTAMVFISITAGMLLVARAQAHHLMLLVVVAAVGVALLFSTPSLVAEYQRDRLEAFLDPTAEVNYNQRQAQIAIGNGGITGTGYGEGTQTKSGLVPEQQTDFIFTVIGEEFGFAGGSVVLACYAVLLWRLYRIARLAGDAFGGYLVTGVMTMFAFQMFQSIGMTMGIMPVTGIPLPFVSYGGSSAVTSYLAVGLALNVHMRRFIAGIDAEVGTQR